MPTQKKESFFFLISKVPLLCIPTSFSFPSPRCLILRRYGQRWRHVEDEREEYERAGGEERENREQSLPAGDLRAPGASGSPQTTFLRLPVAKLTLSRELFLYLEGTEVCLGSVCVSVSLSLSPLGFLRL